MCLQLSWIERSPPKREGAGSIPARHTIFLGESMLEKEKFMKEALKQAKKAYEKGEIPVGAIIVKNNKIIARAYNEKEEKLDTKKHAENLAIQKAS